MPNSPELLALRGARAGHGTPPVVQEADLSLCAGDRLCLVGRNGSGKSTLLAALDGRLALDGGERWTKPGVNIATLPQDPSLPEKGTALEHLTATGIEAHRGRALLHALGMEAEGSLHGLSGGQKRRVALARTLAADADVLLLDEPTNHLDLPAIEWLEKELSTFRGALLVISHDRTFLNQVARGMVWLDRGALRRLDQPFSQFEDWAEQVEREEEANLNRLDQHIKAETRYLNYGITARRKRNQRRLEKLAQLRTARREQQRNPQRVRLKASEGLQSGKIVLEAENLCKSYGGRPIIRDFSLRVMRGDRIGILGPNGAGKTTLIKLLLGQEKPDSGHVEQGANLESAWFDQTREQLDVNKSPWDIIGGGTDRITIGQSTRHVVGYLKDFLFSENQIRGKIATLSGGERNRLLLAKILKTPSNFLVLDEPTNDLDMDTLDLLEEMLGDYQGTLILVSHDRDFLDRLVASILAVEGDGRVREYIGGYSDYWRVRQREVAEQATDRSPKKKTAKSAAKPTPSSRKKLTYKDQREYDRLPGMIEGMEVEIGSLETQLSEPDFYGRDPEGFQRATEKLQSLREEKETAENRWLELEILRESFDKSG